MIDQYHYMTGEEFWKQFQDQIPEMLQPRIERCVIADQSEESIQETEWALDEAEDRVNCLEDDLYRLEKEYCDLDTLYEESKDEISLLVKEIKDYQDNYIRKPSVSSPGYGGG